MFAVRKIFAVAAVLLVLFLGYTMWYRLALRATGDESEPSVVVTVPQGASAAQIAAILDEEGLIRSSLAFRLLAKKTGAAAKLQAGTYALKPSMDAQELLEVLSGGIGGETVVTIPEGFTVKDIDALLAEKGLIKPGDLSECAKTCDFATFDFLPTATGLAGRGGKLEGYLFPDTYYVLSQGFVPKFFLERMLGNFRTRVVTGLKDDLAASDKSLHEIVTMASLVEEETRADEERPVVAGILWKRLEIGMSLGVDATVRYILEKQSQPLTTADLDVDSPYNSRRFTGLPPGPIANPGIANIKAALKPEQSVYLFYLHGSDGRIHYGRTNDEHNANKAYLR